VTPDGDLDHHLARFNGLDTPALTVDLDAVERNVRRMQDYCDEHGFALRPHVKTHKLPVLAQKQVAAGAVGIACQKLGEAEVMASAGLDDILVTFPLVGPVKAERLARLAGELTVGVAADSAEAARSLSEALSRHGATAEFLVECDTGFRRTGVQSPAEAAELARLVDSLPGLRFGGLMTYPTLDESGPWLREARAEIERAGLAVERVSSGGTPTAFRTHEIGGVTEIRVGTYVYGDRACIANGTVALADCALRVHATVVSRPTRDRAILDAGSKGLSSDRAAGADDGTFGLVVEYPDARIYALSEEHGHVDVGACSRPPEIGETVTIVPNHACGTTNMYDEVVAHRDGAVVDTWPIAARGRLR
jgi:D-serine deaminase-like pyridoxal phosphate-dependent protein